MEIRHALQSVCRSAAAVATAATTTTTATCGARPSLLQSAAASAAAARTYPSSISSLHTFSTSSMSSSSMANIQKNMEKLRTTMLSTSTSNGKQGRPTLPPRPPPASLLQQQQPKQASKDPKPSPLLNPLSLDGQIVKDSNMTPWSVTEFAGKHLAMNKDVELRLRPSVGRTVVRSGHVDVPRAFFQMERLCKRNRVRKDVQMQRFHERGGLKRKRLKRERWARRFKVGFMATVDRTMELRRQGW
ncbi:hypothetical protein B0T17DRAFT_84040 [Bombardia bombarda]|uniref:Ribosomal protein S21 n=1 Tax=Bombardia bombarda TaxID=252184 RepID=A0AA40CFP0_9PEZI|nr:hypothetical protein B0T17DRAFT_84040 [Bombardia bombarda]